MPIEEQPIEITIDLGKLLLVGLAVWLVVRYRRRRRAA